MTQKSRDWKGVCLFEVLINFDGLLFGFGAGCGFLDYCCGEAPFVSG